jgi:hypothetical protein
MIESWRELYDEVSREFKRVIGAHGFQGMEAVCRVVPKRVPVGSGEGSQAAVAVSFFNTLSKNSVLTSGKGLSVRGEFNRFYGDSFAYEPKPFRGSLLDVGAMVFGKSPDKAVFFAVLNAVYNYLGLVQGVIRCSRNETKACGKCLAEYIHKNFGKGVVIAHIGYKPDHVAMCAKIFKSYVTDLDPENIGKVKFGRKILGAEKNEEVIKKADIACIAGSSIVNGTLPRLLELCETYQTEPIVCGVTVSAAAKILHLRHFCPFARRYP